MDEVVLDVTEDYIRKGIPIKLLVRSDIDLAFTARGTISGERGYLLPGKIYIKDLFDKKAESLAVDIVNIIIAIFGELIFEVNTIYLSGGGSKKDFITIFTAMKKQSISII